MTLVAGSYEKFIWGFSLKTLTPSSSSSSSHQTLTLTLTLTPLFSYQSHTAPIKSVAAAGPIAASGSSDDTIKIYDLSTSSEIGSLINPSAAVTALSFYTSADSRPLPRNLIAASDDGNLLIFDADPFVHLKTVAAHRGGVNGVAVHRSGRVAITVGRDCCLGMVNLVRGRRSFCCRVDREVEIVKYGEEERFFMAAGERVTAHDAEDARIVQEMVGQKRVLCVETGEVASL